MRLSAIAAAVLGIAALVAAATLVITSGRVALAAPNVITNGAFHTDVAGWTGFETFTWVADDAGGSPSSGALEARMTNPAAPGSNSGGVQCVAVTGGAAYDIAGDIKLPSAGQPAAGTIAGLHIVQFDGASCTGTQLGTPAGLPAYVNTEDGVWYHRSSTITLNASAVSVWIYLNIIGEADASTQSHAYFDNLAFSQGPLDTPTVPATATSSPGPSNTPATSTATSASSTSTRTPTRTATRTATPAGSSTPTAATTPLPAVTATAPGGGAGAGGIQPPDTGHGPSSGSADTGISVVLAVLGAMLLVGGAVLHWRRAS